MMRAGCEREIAMSKNALQGNRARRSALAGCPLAAAFAAIGGKWKLTILYWLAHGELHFAGLTRRAAPISHKVLAQQLRELEADGIVARTPTGPAPAPVI
jgi:DNA-binding HxlR family transcriptional regulator